MDRQELERDLFSQRETLLKPLFKLTSIDGKSTGDPMNIGMALGVITMVRIAGTKAWHFIAEAKDSFPELQMYLGVLTRSSKNSQTLFRDGSSFDPPVIIQGSEVNFSYGR